MSRAVAVGRSHPAVKVSAYIYNVQVVSVLGYVTQLALLPDNFERKESGALNTILHVATNALDHASCFMLAQAGGPELRSVATISASTMIRTALKTFKGWKEWFVNLQHAANDFLPIELVARGFLNPPFWDSRAFARNLYEAAKGFPSHPL